jgi:DNA-binding transcriptional regulator YdaS (Cro superfamily)
MKTIDVVKRYGSKAAVARALGITQNAVVQWGETVPIFRQYQLRELEAKDAAR